MKHDELLQATRSPTYMNSRTLEHPYLVIQAILNLHCPTLCICDNFENGTEQFYMCTSCPDTEYPCATIEAISAELK
jgi:hypothetical protein